MSGYGPRRGFGLLGFLVGLLLLGVVAAVAYNVGLSTGAASDGATAPVVYGHWFGFGGGFGILGFLFFILILALLFRAIFRPWGWGHHGWRGGYGPGGWGYKGTETRDVPPPFEPMLESWHRRMHGEQPSEPKTGSTTESTTDRSPNASPDQQGGAS
jgi:hypothetical protein